MARRPQPGALKTRLLFPSSSPECPLGDLPRQYESSADPHCGDFLRRHDRRYRRPPGQLGLCQLKNSHLFPAPARRATCSARLTRLVGGQERLDHPIVRSVPDAAVVEGTRHPHLLPLYHGRAPVFPAHRQTSLASTSPSRVPREAAAGLHRQWSGSASDGRNRHGPRRPLRQAMLYYHRPCASRTAVLRLGV